MIDKTRIEDLLAPKLEEENLFLVELVIVPEKEITLYVDGMTNVMVNQCVTLTRFLREALGEDGDNYEITVSSPDLDKPFRHPNQYLKNIEKSVEVVLTDGHKISGKLLGVDTEGTIKVQEFAPKKGNRKADRPTLGDTVTEIPLTQIKQTKKLVFI
jgi:ribosome maturation factor RimP